VGEKQQNILADVLVRFVIRFREAIHKQPVSWNQYNPGQKEEEQIYFCNGAQYMCNSSVHKNHSGLSMLHVRLSGD
jgi:hypothetical protein